MKDPCHSSWHCHEAGIRHSVLCISNQMEASHAAEGVPTCLYTFLKLLGCPTLCPACCSTNRSTNNRSDLVCDLTPCRSRGLAPTQTTSRRLVIKEGRRQSRVVFLNEPIVRTESLSSASRSSPFPLFFFFTLTMSSLGERLKAKLEGLEDEVPAPQELFIDAAPTPRSEIINSSLDSKAASTPYPEVATPAAHHDLMTGAVFDLGASAASDFCFGRSCLLTCMIVIVSKYRCSISLRRMSWQPSHGLSDRLRLSHFIVSARHLSLVGPAKCTTETTGRLLRHKHRIIF